VDDTTGIALFAAAYFRDQRQPLNLVAANLYNAQKLYDLLITLVGETNVLFYPVDELLRANTLANNKEMLSQRLYVLSQLTLQKPFILITHTAGALRYVPSPQLIQNVTLTCRVGQSYTLTQLREQLTAGGYQRVNKVDQSLQFAIRGDIVDIVSVNLPHPVRLEFFGEELESIRYFDLPTQTSFESIQQCAIFPASDTLVTSSERHVISQKLSAQLEHDRSLHSPLIFDALANQTNDDINVFLSHQYHARLYRYYGFIQDHHYSVLHYQATALTLIANDDQVTTTAKLLNEESWSYFNELAQEGKQITHLQMYQEWPRVLSTLPFVVRNKEFVDDPSVHYPIQPLTLSVHGSNVQKRIQKAIEDYASILFLVNNPTQKDTIQFALDELGVAYAFQEGLTKPKHTVGIAILGLDEGFYVPDLNMAIVTSKELFGVQAKPSKYFSRYKEATIIQSSDDLSPGDYVVHEYSGIGQYLGVKTIEIDGLHKDYLHIQYAGTDVLYVPLSQFKLVRKFSGKDGAVPKLNRLNSKEWESTKRKIKEKVDDLAERLLALNKSRSVVPGFAFAKDDELQQLFEKQFPHELTPDQHTSLQDIKRDMEQPVPMDRLLCGDVGFGKTEVAFRAAFKAISQHKQVAILAPTTLLARQHYERAIDRFGSFGVNLAIFSRMIPEKKQKEYMKDVLLGKTQLIIGTHRLLSKDIQYADLGLLIVDEEQRFGVEQKEKIKEIKAHVDVLTLSATPIPRTLQISLLGIRQLSQINTSPLNRVPIQTYVIHHDPKVIKELIERELARQGQVYYLHNRVEDIYLVAETMRKTIKGALIGVVHGHMDKDELEDVMSEFYEQKTNILVCTSIIENGIDIANANLIIVEDAANFGLAQLYQIKGRVGRGNRIAYAYLLYRADVRLNEQATKRLKAIQEFTELGSGYKIAQRDLLIRGAGDILGPEQAGFIDTVGLDMYLRLLNEAIEEKKTGRPTPLPSVTPSLMIDAYIPDTFAISEDKVELYQALEEATSFDELESIEKKLRDLYGRLPQEVVNLFKKKSFDLLTESAAFAEWKETKTYVDIVCSESFTQLNRAGTILFERIQTHMHVLKVNYANRVLKIRLMKQSDAWFETLISLIQIIRKTYEALSKELTHAPR
jgi:transcription-repair coupling factor (superfamily II helicase)